METLPKREWALKSCGTDVQIHPTVIIKYPELVSIGNHVGISAHTIITNPCEIGNWVHLAVQVVIYAGGREGKCIIGDYAGISAGCKIICGGDDYLGDYLSNAVIPDRFKNDHPRDVVIGRFCLLGTDTVVQPGVVLAEGTRTGSCTLITKDTEPWGLYIGQPARRVKDLPHKKALEYAKELEDGIFS